MKGMATGLGTARCAVSIWGVSAPIAGRKASLCADRKFERALAAAQRSLRLPFILVKSGQSGQICGAPAGKIRRLKLTNKNWGGKHE
jgi:hypothetical protein